MIKKPIPTIIEEPENFKECKCGDDCKCGDNCQCSKDDDYEELFIDLPVEDDFRKNMLTFAGFVLFMNLLFNLLSEVERDMITH